MQEDVGELSLSSILSSLEEVAQCPVCLQLVNPPVILCLNGHGMCRSCKRSITNCPTCRSSFSSIEPRILNDILQKVPRICKYYNAGCRFRATGDHEVYCPYRTVKCNLFLKGDQSVYCNWEGPAYSWTGHVYGDSPKHQEPRFLDFILDNAFKTNIIKIGQFKNVAQTIIALFPNPVHDEVDENSVEHLIFYSTKLNGNFCMHLRYLQCSQQSTVHCFNLSFENCKGEEVYKYKIKPTAMVWLERDVKVEESIYCMRVPLVELEKLVDKRGDLQFKVSVWN